ncbi:MAG: NAD(P)-dependent alcohol dehydrogenase, partial [Patescibacteria group bacterium]
HAQYIAINEDNALGIIPNEMPFEHAAALAFGATTAIHFLDGLELNNKTMLLNGASGAVGTNILQIASNQGAKVTGVCSTKNVELIKSLGATEVIDYSKQPLESLNQEYDIVIDCINNIGLDKVEKYVKKDGTIILVSGMIKEMLFKGRIKKAKTIVGTAKVTSEQYNLINNYYQKKILKPIILKTLPLESIVEAHEIVDSWRKVGNIVITID